MKNLCMFEHKGLGKIRMAEEKKNEILFCSEDILRVLNYRNKAGCQFINPHSENYITYEVAFKLFTSINSKESIELERWLYGYIFPLIRKYGLHNASLMWEVEYTMIEVREHMRTVKSNENELDELVS